MDKRGTFSPKVLTDGDAELLRGSQTLSLSPSPYMLTCRGTGLLMGMQTLRFPRPQTMHVHLQGCSEVYKL